MSRTTAAAIAPEGLPPYLVQGILAGVTAILLFVYGAAGEAARILIPANALLSIHAVTEILYVAGATAIFCIAWFSPRREYRFRPTLVACFCVPVIAFDLLHLVGYSGMPNLLGTYTAEATFYYGRMARGALAIALALLALKSDSGAVGERLRWSMLLAAFACILPLVWYGTACAELLPKIADDDGAASRPRLVVEWLIVALYLAAAILSARTDPAEHPDASKTIFAAMLAACSQALVIPATGSNDLFSAFAHVCDLLAMGTAFSSIYGDAVCLPYRILDQSRTLALRDRQRSEVAFRSVADGIIVVNNELVVRAMNPVARHLAGCAGRHMLDLGVKEVLSAVDPAAADRIVAALKGALGDGRTQGTPEDFVSWSVAGTQFAIDYSVSPVRNDRGQVRGAVLVLRDMTERRRLLNKLRDSADYARSLIEASLDPMIVVDMDGNIADVNTATELITGARRKELVGSDFSTHFSAPERAREALAAVFHDGLVRDLPLFVFRAHGGSTEVSCNITPYRNTAGEVCGAFAIARDVTEQRQVQLTLEYQASCDPLTALPNRRVFRELIGAAVARSRESGAFTAVLVVDIDDFKDANDPLGHILGDELIKGVAGRLSLGLGDAGTVARIGGDEFGILVGDLADAEDIAPIAGRLLDCVTSPLLLDGGEVSISCSMGVAVHPRDVDNAAGLVRSADTAMRRAKEAGKGGCRYFTAEMGVAAQRRIGLAHRLRTALANDELALHYQPQVRLDDGEIVGVEALLRWEPAGLGAVSPLEFIPIAEDSGLIVPIGEWVLRRACMDAALWQRTTGRDVVVAVNLSARQFRDDDIVAAVARTLAETGLPARLLELELTESLLVGDASGVAATLRALKELGVSIAVDDFGTGYSSLSYLKHFPLDYLKVDRSFVMGIPSNGSDEAIVRTIVALADNLGLEVIAEGVETVEQMLFLDELGCSEIQGYLVSRPLSHDKLQHFLDKSFLSASDAGRTGVSPENRCC